MDIAKATYPYKIVENREILADVYVARDDRSCPTIVWIHGGALIGGHRENISDRQRDRYLEAGYTVVSIDYRLAPETKLPAIIQDLQDAFRWVGEKGAELFNADPTRIAVIGHSAGGYLTLMSGSCVEPRPKALVSFYGYGDIVGSWYSRPDSFYRQQPLVTEEEAYRAVGQPGISGTPGRNERWRFYLYCRQQGLWPKEVAGYDPQTEPDAFRPYCPVQNVTADYPPTLLLHGDRDTDVPYELSVMMAGALAQAGVEHELITIPNGGHGFDGSDHPAAADAFERVLAFLDAHLR
jgi:acetyl esterase/lipase